MSDVVLTACVLHNVCILGEDSLEEFMTETGDDVSPIDGGDDDDGRVHNDTKGRQKRLAVTDELWDTNRG